MCEGGECKCNLPAKITCGVAVGIFLIGALLYVIGIIQAAEMAAQSVIVDGQRTFTLQLEASSFGNSWAGYTLFSTTGTSCDLHAEQIESQLDSSMGLFVPVCDGWARGRWSHGGQQLLMIGSLGAPDVFGTFSGGQVSFSLDYRTWVVDASVDVNDVNDAFALAGITFAGFAGVSIGIIMCCVGGCLMCCLGEKTTPTAIVQQVPVAGPGTAMVVGQPVIAQPVGQVVVQANCVPA